MLCAIGLVFPVFSCLLAAENGFRTMQYASRSPAKAMVWQKDLRAKLFDLLKMTDLAVGGIAIPLAAKTISTTNEDGYTVHELEINSTPTRRVNIALTVPTNHNGPFPAIVLIPGHWGTLRTCYEKAKGYQRVGHILAQQGYVTVSLASQHKVYETGRTLVGERLWDLMRCIDFLKSQKEVDPLRIGCAGKSLGGEMAMWLAAMDQRVHACVVSGFLTDMNQMEKNHCMCWKFPGLRELVDFADIFSLIAPRPLLCQNGLGEPADQFPPSRAFDVLKEIGTIYANYSVPEKVTLVVHTGGHEFHVPSVTSFFAQYLNDRKTMLQTSAPPLPRAP